MRLKNTISVICLFIISGCGVASVNEANISRLPADANSFGLAQKAVRACSDASNRKLTLTNFRKAGFGVSERYLIAKNGNILRHATITAPDRRVKVLYLTGNCYVGLENMTPDQSKQLAGIWVRAHDAQQYPGVGDKPTDHHAASWRRQFVEPARGLEKAAYSHNILIAAFKTWPHGPYDPQRNVGYSIAGIFPDVPGAAVKLSHKYYCKGVSVSPTGETVYPKCSGPDYRAK